MISPSTIRISCVVAEEDSSARSFVAPTFGLDKDSVQSVDGSPAWSPEMLRHSKSVRFLSELRAYASALCRTLAFNGVR